MNNKKLFFHIFIVIIGLLIAVFIGYYLFGSDTNVNNANDNDIISEIKMERAKGVASDFCSKPYGEDDSLIYSVLLCNEKFLLIRYCLDCSEIVLDKNGEFLAECAGNDPTPCLDEYKDIINRSSCLKKNLCL